MICLDCAGQVRDLHEDFHTLVGDFAHPPFHRWCRSTIRPYLPGGVDEQRAEANAEIQRRPLRERRKGPGGVGARIPPPPHQATMDRRAEAPLRNSQSYLELFDQLLDGPDRDQLEALHAYLRNDALDGELRQGRVDDQHTALVAALDAAIQSRRLREQVTVFTAVDRRVARRLRVSDIASSDSYLWGSLDPAVAAGHGTPMALTLPAGLPAVALDRDTQTILLARRHSWVLLALGVILVGVLL